MRVPGIKKLRLARRWTRSRFSPRGVILGYHRVDDSEPDPFRISISPKHFAEQMSVLEEFATVMPLDELAAGARSGSIPDAAVAVTFDDGYRDNFERALPLIESRSVPATIFVTTGTIGGRFWWCDLAMILLSRRSLPRSLSLAIGDRRHEWSLEDDRDRTDDTRRREVVMELYDLLRWYSESDRRETIEELRGWAGRSNGEKGDAKGSVRAMTRDELVQIAQSPLIDLGAHTHTHPQLASLPIEEQELEIGRSRSELQPLQSAPIRSFSYPNGSRSAATVQLVRDAGFEVACDSTQDVVRRGSESLALPRFFVPDVDGDRFARWLRRWVGR